MYDIFSIHMSLNGNRFLGEPYRFTGFAVFGTILNFHHVEVPKHLTEFICGDTPGNAGPLVTKC